MANKQQTEELSRRLATIAGLRLRPPRPGEGSGKFGEYIEAGQLRSLLPEEFFQWRKCPFHNVWLQPILKPFKHWRCLAKDFCKQMHEAQTGAGFNRKFTTHITCKGHVCTFSRPAKLRTSIECRIFAVMQFLEDNA